jgi:hypothetical protein
VAFLHLQITPVKKAGVLLLPLGPLKQRMKYLFISLLALFALSCTNEEDQYHQPENALDAGREFIQQSLKGKFTTAEMYMLQDKENKYWLSKWREEFSKTSEQEKATYNKASINIAEVKDVVPDSITIINYSNSYKKVPQKIKVVKYNGEWKIDFKYTFSGN